MVVCMSGRSPRRPDAGFSLIELLISAALSMIIVGVIIYAFQTATRVWGKCLQNVELASTADTALWLFDDRVQRLIQRGAWYNQVRGISGRVEYRYMRTPRLDQGHSWARLYGEAQQLIGAWSEGGRVTSYFYNSDWNDSSMVFYGFLHGVKDSEVWNPNIFFDLDNSYNLWSIPVDSALYRYEGLRIMAPMAHTYYEPLRIGMIGRRGKSTAWNYATNTESATQYTMPSTGMSATTLDNTSFWFNSLPHQSWAWMVDSETDEYSDVANKVPRREFYVTTHERQSYRGGLRDDTLAVLAHSGYNSRTWRQEVRELIELNVDIVKKVPDITQPDTTNVDANAGHVIHDFHLDEKSKVQTFRMASTFVNHYAQGKESYWRLPEVWDASYPSWPIPGEPKNQ